MNKIYSTKLAKSIKQKSKPFKNSNYIELHVLIFRLSKSSTRASPLKTVWKREPEGFKGYMVMKLDDNILAFWGGNVEINDHPYFKKFDSKTNSGYRVELVIFVSEIETIYKRCNELGCVFEELQQWPWGIRDFRINDPNGFYIRISEPHNILSDENAVE